MWTKEKIQTLIRTNDTAVERALIAIFHRQTLDEKQSHATRHTNHRGFRSNHAAKGTYYAQWCLAGRKLSGYHLASARKIALQYHRQLCEIGNENAEKKAGAK